MLLRTADEGDLLVIWPPATEPADDGGSQVVAIAGGEAFEAIGDDVALAGGISPSGDFDPGDGGANHRPARPRVAVRARRTSRSQVLPDEPEGQLPDIEFIRPDLQEIHV